jgi:hypothetical protein
MGKEQLHKDPKQECRLQREWRATEYWADNLRPQTIPVLDN